LPIPDEENRNGTKEKNVRARRTTRKPRRSALMLTKILPPRRIATGTPNSKVIVTLIVHKISSWSLAKTRYRRAVYRLPMGTLIVASGPNGVDSHFGPALTEDSILLANHPKSVTAKALLEQLTGAYKSRHFLRTAFPNIWLKGAMTIFQC